MEDEAAEEELVSQERNHLKHKIEVLRHELKQERLRAKEKLGKEEEGCAKRLNAAEQADKEAAAAIEHTAANWPSPRAAIPGRTAFARWTTPK